MNEVVFYTRRGRRPKKLSLQSGPFVITDRLGELRLYDDYIDVRAFTYVPGEVFAIFLMGSRPTALLSARAVEYNFRTQWWHKRLTRYYSYLWGRSAGRDYEKPLKISTIFTDALRIEIDTRSLAATKERFAACHRTLQRDGVIASWRYEQQDGPWSEWTIVIEPPVEIRRSYEEGSQQVPSFELPRYPSGPSRNDQLGESIRAKRESLGLSQRRLAMQLGISQSSLTRAESGKRDHSRSSTQLVEDYMMVFLTRQSKYGDKIRGWATAFLDRIPGRYRHQSVAAAQDAEALSSKERSKADGADYPTRTETTSGDWYPDGRLPVRTHAPHQMPARDRASLGKEQSTVEAPNRSHPDFTERPGPDLKERFTCSVMSTACPASSSSVDSYPGAPGLVPRGERYRFLMSLASGCRENGVEQAAILAILKVTNSEYCHPQKREKELERLVHRICGKTTVSRLHSGLEAHSVGLIPRGERYHFLIFVAAACRENGVEPAAVLAILKTMNSEYCHPPKREAELEQIVDRSGRERYSRRRPSDIEINSHGFIPRGQRNEFLIGLAQTCHENHVSQATTLEILRQANTRCNPPKREPKLRSIVDWIGRKPNTRRRRGRKRIFTQDQLQKAHEMKQDGKSNSAIAKVLYCTLNPDQGQRRSVPTILSYHLGSNKRLAR
jgi:transcriptional regulator with XRE-family HTH domain